MISDDRKSGLKLTLFTDFAKENSLFENLDSFAPDTTLIACVGTEDQFIDASELFVQQFTRELTNRNQITTQQLYDSLRIVIKRRGFRLSVLGDAQPLSDTVAIYQPHVERNELIL